jgi:hypothetical protein
LPTPPLGTLRLLFPSNSVHVGGSYIDDRDLLRAAPRGRRNYVVVVVEVVVVTVDDDVVVVTGLGSQSMSGSQPHTSSISSQCRLRQAWRQNLSAG